MGDNDQQHHLETYLTSILPKIGLDPETYAPYITGVLPTADDDNDNEQRDEEELNEELTGIIELLQASSESHGDDEQTWIDLRSNIQKIDAECRTLQRLSKEKADEDRRLEIESKTRNELELAREAQEERRAEELREARERKEMDPAKRALLEQYAYVDSEVYDNDGNLIEAAGGDGGGDGDGNGAKGASTAKKGGSGKPIGKGVAEGQVSNRATAQKYRQETSTQVRSQQGQTKSEERKKTKNSKLDKVKQKEERRKRAVKGERKR